MREIICLNSLNYKIDKTEVLLKLDCYPDSPVYKDFAECYEDIYKDIQSVLKPAALLTEAVLPKEAGTFAGKNALYEILTAGNEISHYIRAAFENGDYVKGMVADAMADSALFSMENFAACALTEYCGRLKRGISRRLEAPRDISIELHRDAFEKTEADKKLGMRLSEGFMFEPVKSVCNIFLLSQDEKEFRIIHECAGCERKGCPMRKENKERYVLTVAEDKKNDEKFLCEKGETVMSVLAKYHKDCEAVCGGTGRCGKCKIIVEKGEVPVSEADRRFFTQKELMFGWRLACAAQVASDMTIRLKMNRNKSIDAVSEFFGESEDVCQGGKAGENHFAFAADIGTTTIAVSMLRLSDGKCLETYTCLNRQRIFGADVISRIQKAADGSLKKMQILIWEDIAKAIGCLSEKYFADGGKGGKEDVRDLSARVETIAVAGNTTMLHLLMGYPCETLGASPFAPYSIGGEQLLAPEFAAFMQKLAEEAPKEAAAFRVFFGSAFSETEFRAFPGISAFVGADITAGMCALNMGQDEGTDILIDLGTNGEMAIGGRERILVASAAAGPAFEGGNITWGTGSIPGAICHVRMEDGKLRTETIQNAPPRGVCGTGLVDAVYTLVQAGIIDETGLLCEPYFESGYPLAETADGKTIYLTQKDIREFQMAKAAIWAGVKTLTEKYGAEAEAVRYVYIAGGFGYRLDYEKAVGVGLLPKLFKKKIRPVGNSSLRGAVLLAENKNLLERAEKLTERCEEISLAKEAGFHEYYMEGMYFPT